MCARRRVLVVEDNPGLRQLLAQVLGDAGYAVTAAEHGGAALEHLPALHPCVILLDLRMPVLDGWAFARAYRQLPAADAQLIAVTSEYSHPRLPELGAVAILPKPFDLDALLATVARWVRAHAPRDA